MTNAGVSARLSLPGHLTRASLASELERVPSDAQPSEAGTLLVDCGAMTGYDPDARALFVEWNREHRDRFRRVAVVTQKKLWHMVIAAMSLASQQEMRAFSSSSEAEEWLNKS